MPEELYNSVYAVDQHAKSTGGRPDWLTAADSSAFKFDGAFSDSDATLVLKEIIEQPQLLQFVRLFAGEYVRIIDVVAYDETLMTATIEVERNQLAQDQESSTAAAIDDEDVAYMQDVSEMAKKVQSVTKGTYDILEFHGLTTEDDLTDQPIWGQDELAFAGILASLDVFDTINERLQAKKLRALSAGEYGDDVFRTIELVADIGLQGRALSLVKEEMVNQGYGWDTYTRA